MIGAVISAEFISAIFCFIILYANNTAGHVNLKKNKAFNYMLVVNIFSTIADMISYIAYLHGICEKIPIIYKTAITISFAGGFLITTSYYQYLYNVLDNVKSRISKTLRALSISSLILAVIIIIMCITGKIFAVSNGSFVVKEWYIFYIGVQITTLAIEIIATLYICRNLNKRAYTALAFNCIVPIITSLIQFAVVDFSLGYIASSISIALIYMMIQSDVMQKNMDLERERKQFRDALMRNALYSFSFDVTDGYIRNDFKDSNGQYIMKNHGIKLPITYDEQFCKYIEGAGVEFLDERGKYICTSKGLLKLYEEHITTEGIKHYERKNDKYMHTLLLFSVDELNGHVIVTNICSDITEQEKQRQSQEMALINALEELKQEKTTIESIANIYNSMHLIDLRASTFEVFSSNEEISGSINSHTELNIQDVMWEVMNDRISDAYKDMMKKFTDFSTLRNRLKNKNDIFTEAVSVSGKWRRFGFIRIKDEKDKFIFVSQDIDETKRNEEELIAISNIDSLTGIYNRHAYEKYVQKLENEGIGKDLWYIAVDVNGLKSANDNIGHHAGDEIIKATADCLKATVSHIGKAFRIGGDEFVVIFRGQFGECRSIINDMKEWISNWHGKYLETFSFSKGIVGSFEMPGGKISDLEAEADKRMYTDKKSYHIMHDDRRKG